MKWLLSFAACASFAAFANDGALDDDFGVGGRSVFSPGYYYYFDGGDAPMVTTGDGRIYMAARIRHKDDDAFKIVLARRMPGGDSDDSFNGNGFRTYAAAPFDKFWPTALATEPDGKLVMAGTVATPGFRASLCRLKDNGDLDTGFGGQPANPGCRYINFSGEHVYVSAVRRQDDGKLVVSIGDYGSQLSGYVMRFNPDGTPDENFGVDGLVTLIPDASIDLYDIAIAPDGKIIAAGRALVGDGSTMLIARLNAADGKLDSSFNGSGIKDAGFPLGNKKAAWASSVVVLADGSIIAAGGAAFMNTRVNAVFKATSTGAPDTTFGPGHDGKVVSEIGVESYTQKVLIQCDGRILLAGTARQSANKPYDFAARRLDRYGNIDLTFGANEGVATVPFDLDGLQPDYVTGAFLQGGQLVIAGYASILDPHVDAFALTRLTSDTIFCNGFEQ